MKKVQGFTLIELMIVVAIIAILAAIALPAYQDYVIRSQVSEGSVLSDGAKTAFAEFYSNRGISPPSNASAGLAQPTSIIGNYVGSVNVATGKIVATYSRPQANAKINGKVLVFSPYSAQGGSMGWSCKNPSSGTNVDLKYLPTVCR